MLKKILLLLISIPLVSETIVVDGELTEQEWQSAFKITEFYETDPYTLKKTDEETIAYIFSNEDGIYVGFINYGFLSERKDKIIVDNLKWNGKAKKSGFEMGDLISEFKIENSNRPNKTIIYPIAILLLFIFGYLNLRRKE